MQMFLKERGLTQEQRNKKNLLKCAMHLDDW